MPKTTGSVEGLLKRHPLISDQVDERELRVILEELERQLLGDGRNAAVVELGCYIGTTSLFIRRLLDVYDSRGVFHVYDSFQGLPEKVAEDNSPAGEQFRAGELSVSRKAFEMQFKKAGLRLPVIHKAWFSDLGPADAPDDIAFAYFDGDYYESIRDSFRIVGPHLRSDATIVVDDYANEALPGAKRAVDEWVRVHGASLRVHASLAIIHL